MRLKSLVFDHAKAVNLKGTLAFQMKEAKGKKTEKQDRIMEYPSFMEVRQAILSVPHSRNGK